MPITAVLSNRRRPCAAAMWWITSHSAQL